MDTYDAADRICGNCAHWDVLHQQYVTMHYSGCVQVTFKAAGCKVGAVSADAGESVILLGENGHCRCHSDEWSPSVDYLSERAEPPFDCVAGRDYPATMRRAG